MYLSAYLLIYLSTYWALVFAYLFNPNITDQGGTDTLLSPICDMVHYPAIHSPVDTLNTNWDWKKGPYGNTCPRPLISHYFQKTTGQLVWQAFVIWEYIFMCSMYSYLRTATTCFSSLTHRPVMVLNSCLVDHKPRFLTRLQQRFVHRVSVDQNTWLQMSNWHWSLGRTPRSNLRAEPHGEQKCDGAWLYDTAWLQCTTNCSSTV